ncbi:hypothetical protein C5167_006277 [Papaver somniferum]|uniref:Uncharacterized protein n=1 Tax=Papaver somniferum TaxID=3469 RepID=A0A4Y7JG06_PAPSO|nr:hypothetical protein C5167_006277 [Papaver somniferum]
MDLSGGFLPNRRQLQTFNIVNNMNPSFGGNLAICRVALKVSTNSIFFRACMGDPSTGYCLKLKDSEPEVIDSVGAETEV